MFEDSSSGWCDRIDRAKGSGLRRQNRMGAIALACEAHAIMRTRALLGLAAVLVACASTNSSEGGGGGDGDGSGRDGGPGTNP